MKTLYLEDLKGYSEQEVKEHIACSYEVPFESLDKWDIIIAYESVGNYGCDSSAWLLLQDKSDGSLWENYGSHCSCHGFEDQFQPEHTSLEYLRHNKFKLSTGGYDNNCTSNNKAVKEFLKQLEVV